jgi:phosphoribosylglycinamide formyltransferase-1
MLRVAVLASANGTNFQALHDACATGYVDGEIACLLTNRRGAMVVDRAERAGVEVVAVPHKGLDRETVDELVLRELDARKIELVCHAGYMRIRGRTYCKALEGRVINVHPSLLPSFPGATAIQDAWEWGVKTSGVTIHFSAEDLDMGPIILQRPVQITQDDTLESFEHKIHLMEYVLYPKAVKLYAEGRLRLEGRRVSIDGDVDDPPWAGELPPGLR